MVPLVEGHPVIVPVSWLHDVQGLIKGKTKSKRMHDVRSGECSLWKLGDDVWDRVPEVVDAHEFWQREAFLCLLSTSKNVSSKSFNLSVQPEHDLQSQPGKR